MLENGWGDIHDEDCPSARPSISSMDVDAAQVNKPISENWRVTIWDLSAALGFSIGVVQNSDKEELGYCRVVARWVPRYIMAEYKNRRFDIAVSHCQRFREERNSSWISSDSRFCSIDDQTAVLEWLRVQEPYFGAVESLNSCQAGTNAPVLGYGISI
jgi:hypothetical protein